MSRHELELEDIDVDGAVRETAAETMDALGGDTWSTWSRRSITAPPPTSASTPSSPTTSLKRFLRTVTDDENQHVKALKKVLGHKAVGKPSFDFHGDNANYKRFLDAAFTFENEGVHAYSGQTFNITQPAYLAAALSIVTVEARHAATVGLIRNESKFGITPNGAFDKPYGASKVLKDVTSLYYITKL